MVDVGPGGSLLYQGTDNLDFPLPGSKVQGTASRAVRDHRGGTTLYQEGNRLLRIG